MKKLSSLLAAASLALAAASCSPSAYTMLVEMRQPSISGMSIAGKQMAVVYLENQERKDTLFSNMLADTFATSLEDDYFGGQQVVSVYNLPKDPMGQYASIDTMAQLAVELGPDVLFIIDEPLFTSKQDGSPKVTVAVYGYDTMAKKDTVYRVTRSATLNAKQLEAKKDLSPREILSNETVATALGDKMAEFFLSEWQNEYFTLMYSDESEKSMKAIGYAEEMKWEESLKTWLDLVESASDNRLRGCYAYNISIACYMLGDYDLALQWLDRADADFLVSNSPGFRKRIKEKMAQ